MAAITIRSDFGAQKNKVWHCPLFPHPFDMKWWEWMPCLVSWMLTFKPAFSLSSFIRRLFSSFLLSAIRVVLSEVIYSSPGNLDSSLCFIQPSILYSAYKLNKQGDNIQPSYTPFPILNQFVVPCPALIVASCPAYRFLRRQVRCSGIPISLRIFHSLLWSTQSKAFA